jgi:beta-lactamase superfamily II metal-dependent hydrolase
LPNLTILDVGHGNSAVLCDGDRTVVIDAGQGVTLVEFLERRGITFIDAVLISHGDADHMGGVVHLLSQRHLTVRAVYLNPDAERRTGIWKNLLETLADARKRHRVSLRTQLTTETSAEFLLGEVRLDILAPLPEMADVGVGGFDLQGRPLTANTMSAVVRISYGGRAEALLMGDLDFVGLENLLAEQSDIRTRLLVFPHHGGRPGRADAADFAGRVCRAVQPKIVVFSIGRGRHGTPLAEIVNSVREATPGAHIACTQLSDRCAATLPTRPPTHLSVQPARGRPLGACCLGTLEIRFTATEPSFTPDLAGHSSFVQREAPTALCGEGPAAASG